MRILVAHRLYHPVLGGSVVLTDCISQALLEEGHEVRVTTKTLDAGESNDRNRPWPVLRTRNFFELLGWVRWADRVIISEQSLVYCAAAKLCRKPSLVIIQSWFPSYGEPSHYFSLIQRWLTSRMCKFVAPSQVLADSWGCVSRVIPNGYDPLVFNNENRARIFDFAFVGRFNADKGPDLFLEALAKFNGEGPPASGIMLGGGELLDICRQKACDDSGLAGLVTFAGAVRDRKKIAAYLNQVKVLVIPNRWEEPFGLVALEGLACGCRLVSTRSGGLRAAAGGHMIEVPKGDLGALISAMRSALDDADGTVKEGVSEHLKNHLWGNISRRLLAETDTGQ